MNMPFLKHCLFISLISGLFIIPFLSICEVSQVSEAREGVVVGEILRTQEYILPLRHGQIVPSKPLLFHWLATFLYQTSGGQNFDEFYLRLPSAVSAISCLLVLFIFIAKLFDYRSAYIGAIIFLSTNSVVCLAKDGRVDMLFCLLLTVANLIWLQLAIECKHRGDKSIPSLGWRALWIGMFTGLSVLAKGPLGLMMVGILISTVVIFWWGWKNLFRLIHPGFLLAIAIPLPWYYLSIEKGSGAFVKRQLIFENVSRFFGGEGITIKPFYYYLLQIWNQGAPWSVVLVILLLLGWYKRKEILPFLKQDTCKKDWLSLSASLIWIASYIFFLSLSAGKRSAYLIMIMPALTIAIVNCLNIASAILSQSCQSKAIIRISWFGAFVSFGALIVCVLFLLERSYPRALVDHREIYQAWQSISPDKKAFMGMFILGCFVAVCISLKRVLNNKTITGMLLVYFFTAQQILTGMQVFGYAIKGATRGYKKAANELLAAIKDSDRPVFLKTAKDESFDSLFFYYPKRIEISPFEKVDKSNVLYLSRVETLSRLDWINENSIEKVLVSGRMIDIPETQFVVFRLSHYQNESNQFQ
ncbi:MAG: glycosyltransferase family 39 protein [Deltaproteobacteria bacterium]|nr:glycosyltransferase family 39 protein [Deltaproteobacteria bacterium]